MFSETAANSSLDAGLLRVVVPIAGRNTAIGLKQATLMTVIDYPDDRLSAA